MSDNNVSNSTIIADVLERIDTITQHVIDIKSDMIRRPEYQKDRSGIYEQITFVQQQTLLSVKEATLSMKERIDNVAKDVNANTLAIEEIKKSHVPWWMTAVVGLVVGGAFGNALGNWLNVFFLMKH